MFEILMPSLTNDVVNFEQLGPECSSKSLKIIFIQNLDRGHTLEPPRPNKYPQFMIWSKLRKMYLMHTRVLRYKSGYKGGKY